MFAVVSLAIYFGGYTYIGFRTVGGLGLKYPQGWHVFTGIMMLAVLGVAGMIFSRVSVPAVSQILGPLGFISTGIWGIFITVFILNDLVNISNLIFKLQNFRYWSTVIALSISVIACIWALLNAALILKVKEVTITVPDLPAPSVKIALISDLHITSFTSPQSVKGIFEKTAGLNPDIIVIAGDVSDTKLYANGRYKDFGFDILKAPYGVYAVTGNHEYYGDLDDFLALFKNAGIPVLQDESVRIDNVITVAGINDIYWNKAGKIKSVLAKTPSDYPVLFLSHRPEAFDAAADSGRTVIQLSGHTHAGQIPPIEIARRYFMKYNYGLYKSGSSTMYVTSGARWWGPPMRFGNFGEIAVITLKKQ